MTLIDAILKKVQSKESMNKYKAYASPPPELDRADIQGRVGLKKRKIVDKFADVRSRVDTTPPRLYPLRMVRKLEDHSRRLAHMYMENIVMVTNIKRQHFLRGRVDCHWAHPPRPSTDRYECRKSRLRQIEEDNQRIYRLIATAKSRVEATEYLLREWRRHRRHIVERAQKPFVLFPLIQNQLPEDPAFIAPDGVKRPRVYLSLRLKNSAALGELAVELFTDVCPQTCRLFTELLSGDGLGYGYVGTCFFRKVPHLFWCGGDVVSDNGFGCYCQRGRSLPIGAENYHFPHSMPGLLSMRVTRNDEMCGIFNITFKALPQFDLKNVVFGRVIRPSRTYDAIQALGTALGSQPVVVIDDARTDQ